MLSTIKDFSLAAVNPAPALKRGALGAPGFTAFIPVINHGAFCGAGFTVQLEVFVEDHWKAVIRYDAAHGFAHIDRYHLDGRKVKKELHLKLSDVLTLADEDIKENWKAYQEEFLEVHR